VQPFGCTRASKDAGCPLATSSDVALLRPSPFEARPDKGPGERLRVTARGSCPRQ